MLDDTAEYKLKMTKLMVIFKAGRMKDNSFINGFMPRVWNKVKDGSPLSDREKECIDQLFEEN